ncbi:MAG: type II secretion system protein GspC, partial [Anaerolineae bacterium]
SASMAELPGTSVPDVTAILKRNIFDSATGPLWPPPVTEPLVDPDAIPEEEFVVDPNAPPPPCEGSLKLVASVHAERFEQWSFATISSGSGKPLLYRQGGQVDGNEVLAIFPSAVFLKPSAGQPCSLALFQDAGSANTKPTRSTRRAPVTASVSSSTRSTGGFTKAELDQNIKRVSDTEYTITRDLVDKVLQNQAALMRSARIVPHEVDGKVVGVKLYGIRRNSLLGQLGLQNGDLMRGINGYDMTSPDRALEAYSKLRSADNLSVALQRRGANVNMSYRIQ